MGPRRYGELRRAVGGVSQKVLTQTLRALERDGIVERTVYNTKPPAVEYRLTALGVCLSNPIGAVRRWSESHFELVARAREASDRRAGRRSTGS